MCAGGIALAAPACPATPISFAFFESGLLYSEKTGGGIDKDVMEELARRSKCQFEFALKPRPRIWQEMERGELMMTSSALRTEERDAFAWAVTYYSMKVDVILRNVNGKAPRSKEEFLKDDSLKMGAARTLRHGEAMDKFIDELRLRNRMTDVPTGTRYEMFLRDRIAAMPFYPIDTIYMENYDASQFTIATDWFPTDKALPLAMMFSKKYFSKAQVQEWRALVQQMKDDGTLKKIFTKYTSKETAERLLQFPPDSP